MRAAVYSPERVLQIVERPLPEPEPGWVRLKVSAVGICGSDLHMYRGQLGNVAGLQPGHEVAGWVDATGDGVALATGDQVAFEPLSTCGRCEYCSSGQYNRCLTQRIFGVTRKGGMAEYITVPAARLFPVAANISANVAALAEPLAVCTRGVARGQVHAGSRVAVLGAGTIGLLSVVAAQAAGAQDVMITARHPHQQALARALGATVFPTAEALLEAVGDDLLDTIIETVGGDSLALTEAVNLAKRGGRIVMLGVFEGSPGVPGLAFSTKELTLVGSNCYSHSAAHGGHVHEPHSDFGLGVELLHAHADRIAPLVTHRYGLAEINDAFVAAADKHSGSIKVQVEPQR